MKIANIDKEILHIVWTTWGISIKFSGKMWLMIILSHKKPEFRSLFRRCMFQKITREGGGGAGKGVGLRMDPINEVPK